MSQREYLVNDICKFYPLIDIDYNRKKVLISAVLFRLYGGEYKSFDIYITGLKIVSECVKKYYDYMTIRLFIDDVVYNDKDVMEQLSNMDIELVRFVPRSDFMINGHSKGLFGTFVRFFPMFDFPNNDSCVCASIDIDFLNEGF